VQKTDDPTVTRRDEKVIAQSGNAIHAHPRSNGQREPASVGLEIVRELVFCRKGMRWRREGHAVEAREAGGCKKLERVPTLSPGVPDLPIGVEDDEPHATPGEVVSHRQPGLTAANDHRVQSLELVSLLHDLAPFRVPAGVGRLMETV